MQTVWFLLKGKKQPTEVSVAVNATVSALKTAIYARCPRALANVDDVDLQIFLKEGEEQALNPMKPIPEQEKDNEGFAIPFFVEYPDVGGVGAVALVPAAAAAAAPMPAAAAQHPATVPPALLWLHVKHEIDKNRHENTIFQVNMCFQSVDHGIKSRLADAVAELTVGTISGEVIRYDETTKVTIEGGRLPVHQMVTWMEAMMKYNVSYVNVETPRKPQYTGFFIRRSQPFCSHGSSSGNVTPPGRSAASARDNRRALSEGRRTV